jgi:hypothetical protein
VLPMVSAIESYTRLRSGPSSLRGVCLDAMGSSSAVEFG